MPRPGHPAIAAVAEMLEARRLFSASISGTYFNDLNSNGTRETGEAGIAGQTVYLDLNEDSAPSAGEPSAITDANGNYTIAGIAAGTYLVASPNPGAGSFISPLTGQYIVTVADGAAATGKNFARSTKFGSVTGRLYNDLNANGKRDTGEPVLAGWTVEQYANGPVAFCTTDSKGRYGFRWLTLGAGYGYSMSPVAKPGWVGTDPLSFSVSTFPVSRDKIDFGLLQGNIINGRVVNDHDASGDWTSGDTGLQGWTVWLDDNNNSVLDAGEMSTTTSGGAYQFIHVQPGTHYVRVKPAAGWHSINTTSPVSIVTTLANQTSRPTLQDFWFSNAARISGKVFNDKNSNGAIDSGEAGISRQTAYIDANNNSTFDSASERSAVSDDNGFFVLDALAAGTYRIRLVRLSGVNATVPAATGYRDVTVSATQNSTNNNFGVRDTKAPYAVDDFVSGIFGAGGSGTKPFIFLVSYADDQDRINPASLGAGDILITGPNGFSQVATKSADATYFYQFTPPGGSWDPSDNGFYHVALQANQVFDMAGNAAPAKTFAEPVMISVPALGTGRITGIFYDDADADGIRDTSETGFNGTFHLDINLYDDVNRNGVFDSGEPAAYPNFQGYFEFSGLAPGTHRIAAVPLPGYAMTGPHKYVDINVVADQTATHDIGASTKLRLTGTVIGTTGAGTNVGANAFDNNLATFFDAPAASKSTAWVGLDLGSAKQITGIQFAPRNNNEGRMIGGSFQASNTADFSSGVKTFYTIDRGPASGFFVLIDIYDPAKYRYVRYLGPVNSYGDIADLMFFTNATPPVIPKPMPPEALDPEITPPGSGTVFLTWLDPGGNATSFVVERATDEAFTLNHVSFNSSVDSFTDATITTSGTYWYRVKGRNSSGDSDYSDPVPITVSITGSSIAGNLFDDVDGYGDKGGSTSALSGWQAFLDTNKDGVRQTTETLVTSDSLGNYKFNGLAAGTYRVAIVLKSGFQFTAPATGYLDVTVAAKTGVTGKDFGARPIPKPSIGGTLFNDVNGNGVRDPGEAPLDGWRVYVDSNNDGIDDLLCMTDLLGEYNFYNLPAGTYRVTQPLMAGWTLTSPASITYFITITAGQSVTGKDFGDRQIV